MKRNSITALRRGSLQAFDDGKESKEIKNFLFSELRRGSYMRKQSIDDSK